MGNMGYIKNTIISIGNTYNVNIGQHEIWIGFLAGDVFSEI